MKKAQSVRQRWFSTMLCLAMVFSLVSGTAPREAAAATSAGFQKLLEESYPVAPGVQHTSMTLTDGGHIEAVNMMEVDTKNPAIKLAVTSPKNKVIGLDTVRNQAASIDREGHRVVGAFNMDFFNTDPNFAGIPVGMQITDGELITANARTDRPTFAIFPDGNFAFVPSVSLQATVTTWNGQSKTFSAVNKPRTTSQSNHLMLYTPKYNTTTKTSGTGVEVVVQPTSAKLAINETITAVVESVQTTSNNAIPAGKFVISASGAQADWVKANLIAGQQIELKTQLDNGLNAAVHAVSGGPQLVVNGQATPEALGDNVDRHPRTFLATKQGKLYVIAFDGRQPTYSDGVTLAEAATYLASIGMEKAINVDGGGSTTYATRQPGDASLTVVNRPSDGYERAVSNALMVVSTAPVSELAHLVPQPKGPIRVLAGSTIPFVAKGQDVSYNPVPVDSQALTWQVDPAVGTINGQGLFTAATGAGQGKVTVQQGAVSKAVEIEVVSEVARLQITPSPAVINPATSQTFTVSGFTADGKSIWVSPERLNWSVTGDIGTISNAGVLATGTGTATGKVIATYGNTTVEALVNVGKPPVVLEDFEDITDLTPSAARATGVTLELTSRPKPVRFGTHAMKLNYDFSNQSGTSAAYVNLKDTNGVIGRPIEDRPSKLGLWVYGDGKNHWLRGQIQDGNGTRKAIDFTGQGQLNWIGWKYVEAILPSDAVLPLQLRQIYLAETSSTNKNSGAIYFDHLRAVYSDTGEDLVGPTFKNLLPAANKRIFTAQPEVSAVVTDDGSGVDAGSLKMTVDGALVAHHYDPATGKVSYSPAAPLSEGVHSVVIDAVDKVGNPALPRAEWSFTVYTGPDLDPPSLSVIAPMDGTVTRTNQPRIAVKMTDEYKGVDFSQSKLLVDGAEVAFELDQASSTLFFTPDEKWSAGSQHVVKATAVDRENNKTDYQWSFTIGEPLGQPQDPEHFQISLIGDGGYYTAGQGQTAADILLREQIARINQEPSELVAYTGDIVENDTAANYQTAIHNMNQFKMPYVVSIGNHEISGTNSRVNYQKTFGEPTYFYDYGNARIIGLDSASGKLSNSDMSQWPWLSGVLAETTQTNILIIMHVPPDETTADGVDFNTGHGFKDAKEAARFYDLLGSYKAAHPEKNILVFSGDLHAYHHKKVQGVDYVITGGGGKYTHIPAAQGGFYHYLNLKVDGDRVQWDVIPLLESISFATNETTLRVLEQTQLSAAGKFMTSTNEPITLPIAKPLHAQWLSSDTSIATVDANGNVTAVAPGEVDITVKSGWREAKMHVSIPTELTSDLSNQAQVGGPVEYRLTTQVNQALDAGKRVNLKITLADPTQKNHLNLHLRDGQTGKQQPIKFDEQGVAWLRDANGYSLQNGTDLLKVLFSAPGTYAYQVELVELSSGQVLAAKSEHVQVVKR